MRLIVYLTAAVAISFIGCGQESAPTSVTKTDESVEQTTSETPPAEQKGEPENEQNSEPETTESDAGESEEHTHGPGMGMGHGNGGPGRGMGMGRGGGFRADMSTIHAMFAATDKITRTVKNLPTGAEAITESDDKEIAGLIQEHVPAMETRVHENEPLPPMTFHPVFQALIKHADDYTLNYEETAKGMKVTYEAEDPFVIMLVQEHAKLVSRFLKNGMQEIHKPYELPTVDTAKDDDENPKTSEAVK